MKHISNCPKCGDPLLHVDLSHDIFWGKKCHKYLDHKFSILVTDNDVVSMEIKTDTNLNIVWSFLHKYFYILSPKDIRLSLREIKLSSSYDNYKKLPWFEPDISDYNSLLDKVKKYITFS